MICISRSLKQGILVPTDCLLLVRFRKTVYYNNNSVISSIPNYFNNSETPIICYKYNKPIRSTIFNFNKIVNDLDIDSNTPAS